MSDEQSPQAAAPELPASPQLDWLRSPVYRVIYSNAFRFRVGPGEASIVHCLVTDTPGSPTTNLIQEEVCISLSWPHLKMLAAQLSGAVEAIEAATGPIPVPHLARGPQEYKAEIEKILKSFELMK